MKTGALLPWDPDPSKHCCCFFFYLFVAGQEKVTPKKTIDLFDDGDEDGDIFSEKYRTPASSKKEVVEEQVKHPEKKVENQPWQCEFHILIGVFCGL